ncbi:MAG: 2-amino-4-hydroxy-6-hydroxymethyldihydropteridine diphosphokinase [Aliivibrio sp.]|uniref:2-amino-4-hydroxy-6- hydroxymethyldihydropteridine diphosphokinase n=1 Tax=Aliivibrio sp. TaxID=1872443 RepID=UPI001A57B6CE|nr:2-amino-4-hydroxy-6-hydroxymethyldihydropteridine diphosphokinase [Aliivibrio sp.]
MKKVYIALGSNLGDSITQVKAAINALNALPLTSVLNTSSLYSSAPMGPQDQPDYINAVVVIETNLQPLELLDQTQRIELEHGRERKDERWGPRTLDLDILLYANEIINNDRLTIPHYGMKCREFVLYPLAEIAPNLTLPDGIELTTLLTNIDKNGLTIWNQ